jgi:hypothetical protein
VTFLLQFRSNIRRRPEELDIIPDAILKSTR